MDATTGRSSSFARRLARRMALVVLPGVVVLTLVAPAPAHAAHRSYDAPYGYYDDFYCADYLTPLYSVPVQGGHIIIYIDDCGYRHRYFQPCRSRFYDDDYYYDDYDNSPNIRANITFVNY